MKRELRTHLNTNANESMTHAKLEVIGASFKTKSHMLVTPFSVFYFNFFLATDNFSLLREQVNVWTKKRK